MGKRKPNPKKIPRSQADMDKAYRLGVIEGVNLMKVVAFTALIDKGIIEKEAVPKVWEAFLYVTDSVKKGYVNIFEQKKMLTEEYGVEFYKE